VVFVVEAVVVTVDAAVVVVGVVVVVDLVDVVVVFEVGVTAVSFFLSGSYSVAYHV
jgi:hypothetical protein